MTTRPHSSLRRVPAWDGLRGLAVLGVLLFHSELRFARGGYLGVSAFFTLSGFLITSLLLAEQGRGGRISLSRFWARRARRLLPAAFVTLAGLVLFGATIATTDQVRSLRGDVLAALGYVANWRFYATGQSYTQVFSAPSPALHFWSLAIEEQFYVVFPLVFAGALWLGRGRIRVLGALLAAGTIGAVWWSHTLVATHDQARVYFGTDTRVAEIMVGALLAVVLARRPLPRGAISGRVGLRVLDAAALIALATMLWWWSSVGQGSHWLYEGGFAVHALLTVTVIAAASIDGLVARLLALRPLVALGLVSYGVYLYHWPIFLWLSPERTGLAPAPLFLLRVACTLAVASASFVLLERPTRTGRALPRMWPRVALPATASALVGALVAVTWVTPAPEFVVAPLTRTPSVLTSRHVPVSGSVAAAAPTPSTTPPSSASTATTAAAPPITVPEFHRPLDQDRPLRVLVVGDSVGVTVGRGAELYARETGRVEVRNEAVPWCSLGRYLPRLVMTGIHQGEGCDDWESQWSKAIRTFDPDVVFVMYTIWEVAGRRLPGDDTWRRPGDPLLDRWQLGEYRAAADVLSARGARVVWLTIPCDDAPIEVGDPIWTIDNKTIPALARSRDAVRVIDLAPQMCPGNKPSHAFGSVPNARPDGAHYSDAGALELMHWLMPIVLGEAPPPVTASVFPAVTRR